MGDFNEVRDDLDRIGSLFNPVIATRFNQFIEYDGLADIPPGGPRYTWIDK